MEWTPDKIVSKFYKSSTKKKEYLFIISVTYFVPWRVGAVAEYLPVFNKCNSVVLPALSNPISKNFPFFWANPKNFKRKLGSTARSKVHIMINSAFQII